jgi:DNA-binding Lrp family transcriptional regulator
VVLPRSFWHGVTGDVTGEAMQMMSQPDYLLRIATTDADSFEVFYMDHLASLPHVQTLTSQLAMKTVKRSHAVLPR